MYGPFWLYNEALMFCIGWGQLQETNGGNTASHAGTSTETSNIFPALEIAVNKLSDSTCLTCGTLTQDDGVLDCL